MKVIELLRSKEWSGKVVDCVLRFALACALAGAQVFGGYAPLALGMIGASGAGSTKTYVIETGLEEKLRACLDDAAAQVKHPVSAELVKRVRDRFEEYLAQAKTPKKKK